MAPTKLRVALDWTPNTIHSGLFLAKAKGIYEKHNLDVELLPPDQDYSKTPARRLEAGEVDLAICPSESCIAYNESGKMRLQAIYAILQKDASAIYGPTLSSMADLANGKVYGSYNARYEDKIVEAMVEKDGGDESQLKVERSEGKLSMFDAVKAGRIDATWIFLPWEGVEAEQESTSTKYFLLEDYDIPYGYSPVIARNAGNSPPDDILKAFATATREGYVSAIKNVDEVAELLRPLTVPSRSAEFLERSQAQINDYYSAGHAPGLMDPARWSTWLKWLRERGLLTGPHEIKEEDLYTNDFAA